MLMVKKGAKQVGQPKNGLPISELAEAATLPEKEASGLCGKSEFATPTQPATYSELAANAALVLIEVACSLLDRQIKALADAFAKEGGFSLRLFLYFSLSTASLRGSTSRPRLCT